MNSILTESKLKQLPRPIRNEPIITPKIIHFGPGAFFRSFLASLIDRINQKDDEKWGILAVSLNSENTFKKLSSQDFVYNSLSMSSTNKQVQKICSISDFIFAKRDGQSVLNALSDEQVEIVSLTVTEKGYYYNSGKKELDFENQSIIDDLENPENPKTAVGFIVAGVIRSTIEDGKQTSFDIQFAKLRSIFFAKSKTIFLTTAPLFGRLSQLKIVNGIFPFR